MRICSLLPSATEIVYALGLGDQLYGVSHECNFPREAKSKPIVIRSVFDSSMLSSAEIDCAVKAQLRRGEGVYTIDLDRLRQAKPDLILTQELCDVCAVPYREVKRAVEQLDSAPRLLSLSPLHLGDVLNDIRRVGEATGRARQAESLITCLQSRIDLVVRAVAGSTERPKTFCVEWVEPIYAAGHWVPEMVQMAGGIDRLGRRGKPSIPMKWERVVRYAPEVVILMGCGFDLERNIRELSLLTRLPGWRELPAVGRDRVYAVNARAYFSRSGPRLVDGLELLAKILHPELFPGAIPEEAARQLQ
ncbi:MAG: cobalamin-binding protein [candidate division NC10 bacterium]|nr:cobalamin-binding protein [candidate division NC10 bacterium]MDE2321622.1 cobalamin-binding protein [candidate division NC10 bacterium]